MADDRLAESRGFLKDHIRKEIDFSQTAQRQGAAPPPLQKDYDSTAKLTDLVAPAQFRELGKIDLFSAIANRESRRQFSADPLSTDKVSFLLWATQGIREKLGGGNALRTVPSAGCRHAFETYVAAQNIEGLAPGIYRYLPVEHKLVLEYESDSLDGELVEASLGQRFLGGAAATFIWTTIPARMEWRYGPASHKVIALDAGHVCQNLYLACEAIGAGTCAVAAYDQTLMDQLVGVDGEDEFVIYLAPVGRV